MPNHLQAQSSSRPNPPGLITPWPHHLPEKVGQQNIELHMGLFTIGRRIIYNYVQGHDQSNQLTFRRPTSFFHCRPTKHNVDQLVSNVDRNHHNLNVHN